MQDNLGDARGRTQTFFADLYGFCGRNLLRSQMIEHAKFDGLLFRSAAGTGGRSRQAKPMERRPALPSNAVGNGAFELGAQREHGAEDFAGRREIVIGNPTAEAEQLVVKHRSEVEPSSD